MKDLRKELERAELKELLETPRPTEEQRRRDLEKAIGTFEDALFTW